MKYSTWGVLQEPVKPVNAEIRLTGITEITGFRHTPGERSIENYGNRWPTTAKSKGE